MLNLEERINHVVQPEVRPLVAEAYRCYSTGTPRAAIVLTWSAVCADLIHKIYQLAEDGDSNAAVLVQKIDQARGTLGKEAVRQMQQIENSLPAEAVNLELLDFTEQGQLERLREDRNLCAHPSLRPMGEVFTPSTDYARAHLTAALDALLTHPASQGRKTVDRFRAHVSDATFIESPGYLMQTFVQRVKPSASRQIMNIAAKHAMLELPVDESLAVTASVVAERMATCLMAFAEYDKTRVRESISAAMNRFNQLPVEPQLRALNRLGQLDAFSGALEEAVCQQLNSHISQLDTPSDLFSELKPGVVDVLSLAAVDDLRSRMPALEMKFSELHAYQQAVVIQKRPSRYFAGFLAGIMREAASFRMAETYAQTVLLPSAGFMEGAQVQAVLEAWAENRQCREAARMPDVAVAFWTLVDRHYQTSSAWTTFIDRVREQNTEGLTHYQYDDLAKAIKYDVASGNS